MKLNPILCFLCLFCTLFSAVSVGAQVFGDLTASEPSNLADGSFEMPSVGTTSYAYNPVGSPWTFSGNSGLEADGSAARASNAPDGTQAAFLQGYLGQARWSVSPRASAQQRRAGRISQSVRFAAAGNYMLKFQGARRAGLPQPLRFSVDGVQVGGLLTPASSRFSRLTTAIFTVSSLGLHTLTFSATNNRADLTAFIDQIVLLRVFRILPLGDSITRGSSNGYGNYRRPLQQLLTQGAYAYQFVGANTEESYNYHGSDPGQLFNPYQPEHEGYGGFRIDQISGDVSVVDDGGVSYPGLTQTLLADKPDVILVMLGTNDVTQFYDPGGPGYAGASGFAADAAARLNTLIDRLYAGRPELTVVLASITPLSDPGRETIVQSYNAYLPQIVAAHRSVGQNVLFADMHAELSLGDLSPDGVHPGTLGCDKMAGIWYGALTSQPQP